MTAFDDEIAIIGCCLEGGLDATLEVCAKLRPSDFTQQNCSNAFAILQRMVADGKPVSAITLAQEWKEFTNKPLPIEIATSPDKFAGPSFADHHINRIREASVRRKLRLVAAHISDKADDESVSTDELCGELMRSLDGVAAPEALTFDAKGCATACADDLEYRFNLQGKLSGIETGFGDLDRLTDGLQRGEQTIIAARPSMGKTAIGINIIENVCLKQGIPCLIVSCEMSTRSLMRRLLSSSEQMPMSLLRRGSYTASDHMKIQRFVGKLKSAPIHVIQATNGITTTALSADVRRICRKHEIQLVVVDYLQKILPSRTQEKRTYEVAEVSGALKTLAVATNAAFLTLAQLNRESDREKGRAPKLSDLADSGQIERDADTVALIHRRRCEEDPTGADATLFVAKQRDGECGAVKLRFDGAYCRFNQVSREDECPV